MEEWKRIVRKSTIWGVLGLLLLANVLLFYRAQTDDEQSSHIDLMKTVYYAQWSSYEQEYRDIVPGIEKNLKRLENTDIYNEENGFILKNARKTLADYQKLEGIELTSEFDQNVTAFSQFSITDYLFLAFAFLLILEFWDEDRGGIHSLTFGTPKGRNWLAFYRLTFLIVALFFSGVLFYGSTLFSSIQLYGSISNRTIQSVMDFKMCYLSITVYGYLALFLLIKIGVVFFIALLLWMLCLVLRSYKKGLFTLVVVLAVAYMWYANLDENSVWNYLKYFNIWQFLDVYTLVGTYKNMNLFGTPISLISFLELLPLLLLWLSYGVVHSYGNKRGKEKQGILSTLWDCIRKRCAQWGDSTNLFWQEGRKQLFAVGGVFCIIVFALLLYWEYEPRKTYSNSDSYVTEYYKQLEGYYGSEMEEKFATARQEVEEIEERCSTMAIDFQNGTITEDEYYKRMIEQVEAEARTKALDAIEEKLDYLRTLYEEKGISGYLMETGSYQYLFGTLGTESAAYRQVLAVLFLMIFTLAGVYAYDKKNEMQYLITATQKGRQCLFVAKLGYMLGNVLVFTLGITILEYVNAKLRFGLYHWEVPVQSVEEFYTVPWSFSIAQFAMMVVILRLFMGISIGVSLLYISYLCKSVQGSLWAGVIFLGVPAAVEYVGVSGIRYVSVLDTFVGSAAGMEQSAVVWIQAGVLLIGAVVCSILLYRGYGKCSHRTVLQGKGGSNGAGI
jgi:hypothetical protein